MKKLQQVSVPMITIFAYLDYRAFLRDFLTNRKQEQKSFSQRYIHMKMNVPASSGFLANVIAGKKNLTEIQVLNLSKILKLNKSETSFFENLVRYNHARALKEKNEYLQRLVPQQKLKLQRLHPDQMNVFSKWQNVYIRELIGFLPVKSNFEEVGRMLDPPISPGEVREALASLEKMGLATRDAEGYYRQRDAFLTTGNETDSLHLAHFQLFTMDRAKLALQTIKPEDRDISVVACALSPDGFNRVKETIQACRKQVLQIAQEDTSPCRVYQCNFQFYPVSRKREP
jgi:uncharacterized protein (TIGR02147 family)